MLNRSPYRRYRNMRLGFLLQFRLVWFGGLVLCLFHIVFKWGHLWKGFSKNSSFHWIKIWVFFQKNVNTGLTFTMRKFLQKKMSYRAYLPLTEELVEALLDWTEMPFQPQAVSISGETTGQPHLPQVWPHFLHIHPKKTHWFDNINQQMYLDGWVSGRAYIMTTAAIYIVHCNEIELASPTLWCQLEDTFQLIVTPQGMGLVMVHIEVISQCLKK